MVWVRQDEFSSATPAALRRTQYLAPLRGAVQNAIGAYLSSDYKGEEVTLAVLKAVGAKRLRDMAARPPERSFDRVKQDVGLLVPQTLVGIYGPTKVWTLRADDRRTAAPRRNTWPDLTWVNKFTPHFVGDKPPA